MIETTNKPSREVREKIWEMREQGKPIEEIAEKLNIFPYAIRNYIQLREKGFNSFYEYQKDLAKKKGFNSLYEYDKDLGKKRQEKSAYKRLGNLINYALEQIGKNRSWLAREINVSKQMISNYCYGKNYPSPEVLDRIYSALEFKGLLIDGKGLEGLL